MCGLDQLASLGAAHPLAPACDHFHFLRHGQTGRNAQRIFQAIDEPLSELGLVQAERAAERLSRDPIRTVAASDARRALDTACTVASRLGLTPTFDSGLRERDFGALIAMLGIGADEVEIGNAQPLRFERRPAGGAWRVQALLPASASGHDAALGAAIA
jgi:broad specificity phosphatase PhoE